MSTFSHSLWSLPRYALMKPRLFFYCSMHAWLAWPFILLSFVGAALLVYPSAHLWLSDVAYPAFIFKHVSWQDYSTWLYYLPVPFELAAEHQAILLPVSIAVFLLSYPIIAMQLPEQVDKAEKKAWILLKRSEKNRNIIQAKRNWRKAIGLLTKESERELVTLFPKPSARQRQLQRKKNKTGLDRMSKGQVAKIQKAKSRSLKGDHQARENNKSVPKEYNDRGIDFTPVSAVNPHKVGNQVSATHAAITSKGVQQRHVQRVEHRKLSSKSVQKMKVNQVQADNKVNSKVSVAKPISKPVTQYATSKADAFSLPCRIGSDLRYELQEELAKGGMGIVFGGTDTTLQRAVAVKQLYQHLCSDQEQLNRFKQEALLLARLNHPNIVPIYDLIDDQGQVWIVMEWLTAGCLDDMLQEAALPLKFSINIILEIASALELAHRHDIIHRDIKPMNILMTQSGSAKLSDFGTAKFSQSVFETQEGLAIGSPAYMSPEQAAGKEVDARSDIYSLGVTCYQLVTGELPFKGDTIAMMSQHITQQAQPPMEVCEGISVGLSDIIMKMMAKNPEQRYQTMKQVQEALTS